MRIREMRKEAREILKGRWMQLVIPMFIVALITGIFSILTESVTPLLIANPIALLVTQILLITIQAIFTAVLSFGMIITVMDFAKGENVGAGNLLINSFKNIKRAICLNLRMFAKILPSIIIYILAYILLGFLTYAMTNNSISPIVAWASSIISVVLVAVAIIKLFEAIYDYAMSYFIAVDNPDKNGKEIFDKSREIMKGSRAQLMVLPVTFIGWTILAVVLIVLGAFLQNIIWPPVITYLGAISTVPWWGEILMIIFTLGSVAVSTYMIVTIYSFYKNLNGIGCFNEGYTVPETNPKKYIGIIALLILATIALYFVMTFINLRI